MADGRTITIGGKQYLVTADMADALEAQEKEWKAKLDTPAPKPEPVVTPDPVADKSIADRIFTDPDSVMAEVKERAKREALEEFERREQEREARRSAERNTQQFWADFQNAHSDLKGDVSLAKTVLNDEQGQFQKFMGKDDDASKKECIDLLADLTRKRIQAYIARQKESSGAEGQPNHPFVEGATLKFGSEPPRKTEGDKPSSLTDIIKARAAARQKGGKAA